MNKINYFFIFITILISSCNHNNKNFNNKEFKKSFSVNGKVILDNNVNISKFFIVDTLLLAKLEGDDYHYIVFNSKTLNPLGKLAKKGKGPNEFPDVLQYEHHIAKNNQLKIWVYGWNTHKIYLINISNSIKNQNTIIDTVLKLAPQIKFNFLFVTDNYKVIGNTINTTTDMKRLLIYDIEKNKIIKEVNPFPKIENNNEDIAFIFYKYNWLFLSSLASNPNFTKFASAMLYFNRIDIFDKNGNIINSYEGKNNITKTEIDGFFSTEIGNYANIKKYYSGTTSSGNFIYTIYYNKKASKSAESLPVKIRIFNWNAELVCELNIPNHLTSIAIDEKNGIMYGVAFFDEKILKYDISSILNEIKTESR
jgi:hypothetical protein